MIIDPTIRPKNYVNKCGCYKITNTINGKMYIGCSINLESRAYKHRRDLKHGKSHNPHLQSSYNKYGPNNFVWSPILLCEEFELDRYEKAFIKQYKTQDRNFGYNITEGGDVLKGTKAPNFGKHWSNKSIELRSQKRRKPVIQLDKDGNFIKEFRDAQDASQEVGCKKGVIQDVCRGKEYCFTAGGFKWQYKLAGK